MNRKIKICQVITRMDWGGSPDILRILCRKLDPRIFDLQIAVGKTLYPSENTRAFFEDFKERIVFIPELKREIDPWSDLVALRKLAELFRKEKFDLVHTHTAKAGALGRVAARFCGVPVIVHTPHGHNFYGYFNRFLSGLIILAERILANFCDRIIVLTELEKDDYRRYKVASGRKTALVYLGLETERFKPLDPAKAREELRIAAGQKTVGFIGRLEPVKGPQYFVEAARLCLRQDKNLRFVLAGEGSLRKSLESLVNKWGLQEMISFIGWREDVARLMSALDILVLPSLNEAVGMVLIEAQLMGLPVVASKVGGIPEIIQDGLTGVLVDPADPLKLSEAIIRLAQDPRELAAMSEAARNRSKELFSAERMAESTSAVYREALNEKNILG